MNYGELWFLELGVVQRGAFLPLGWLPDSDEERRTGFSEQWNCPHNGLCLDEITNVLWRLQQSSQIELITHSDDAASDVVLVPSSLAELQGIVEAELEAARQLSFPPSGPSPFRYWYRVTSDGIAKWEQYAKPDWSRYRGDVEGQLFEPGETVWSQEAMTEDFAREVIDLRASDPFEPIAVRWSESKVEQLVPWEPMPGKQLPSGVVVSVPVTELERPDGIPFDDFVRMTQLEEFNRRFGLICKWFENSTHNHPARQQ